MSAQDIVDGLTSKQVRVALLAFVEAVVQLDGDGDQEAFIERMRRAADLTERMALEVAA